MGSIPPEDEEWRPIPGWEDRYQLSPKGDVLSTCPGRKPKLLKHHINKDGHHVVTLSRDGTTWKVFVHRLVALTFLDEQPEDKPFVLHRDDDKDNNHWSNLYYGDGSDNQRDAHRNGRQCQAGIKNNAAKLSEATAARVLALRASGMTIPRVAENVGISVSNAKHIVYGESWA